MVDEKRLRSLIAGLAICAFSLECDSSLKQPDARSEERPHPGLNRRTGQDLGPR